MRVSLIVAMAENRVIGRDNELPWRLSTDLRRFKVLTLGHTVLMGRRTYESIGRPLPERHNLVLSRDDGFAAPGATVVRSWSAAMAAVEPDAELFVIGGATVFERALPIAERIYLTLVHAEVEGDTHFPPFDRQRWRLTQSERHRPGPRDSHPFSFQVWERVETDGASSAAAAAG